MDSGVTKIGFARSAFFSVTQKDLGRISLQISLFCAFLTVKIFFLRREAFFDQNKKTGNDSYI